MTFDFNDVWVLQSVFHSEEKNEAELSKIIAYSDYVNHAIITYEELVNGLTRLNSIGLVAQNKNRFHTSPEFKTWHKKKFSGKKRIYYSTEQKEILKFLQHKCIGSNLNSTPSIHLSKEDYQLALKEYVDRMNHILSQV